MDDQLPLIERPLLSAGASRPTPTDALADLVHAPRQPNCGCDGYRACYERDAIQRLHEQAHDGEADALYFEHCLREPCRSVA
jgi:hypothetical protein